MTRLRWHEAGGFEVTAASGARIRVSTMLEGLGWFAAAALDEAAIDEVADQPTARVLAAVRAELRAELQSDPAWQKPPPPP
jgi:hypothetical protein